MPSSLSPLPSAAISTTSSSSIPSPMTFDHLYRQAAQYHDNQNDNDDDNQHSHSHYSNYNSRTQVLLLGAAIGELCTQIVIHAPLDPIRNNDNDSKNDPDPFWNQPSSSRQQIYTSIAKVFQSILLLAHTTNTTTNLNSKSNSNLQSSILKKMQLNARKYPVHLCKGKSGKYTEYSKETGITVENQSLRDIDIDLSTIINTSTSTTLLENLNLSLVENDGDDGNDTMDAINGIDVNDTIDVIKVDVNNTILSSSNNTMDAITGIDGIDISKDQSEDHDQEEDLSQLQLQQQLQVLPKTVLELTAMIREFSMDRNWSTYHTPRNIVLALMGEMGELAEIFQWVGDSNATGVNAWPEDKKDHLEQELADVSIYCLRLADVVGIRDLGLLVHHLFVGDGADGDGDGDDGADNADCTAMGEKTSL
jgi:NTP pyrophosphatase (non-canonical NTP hydrolase)